METMGRAGASRPQTTPYRRPAAVNRNAEDPFEAANGTLHFASERKTASRSAAAPSRSSAASRSTGSAGRSTSGTVRRTTSGGSSRPTKKRKRRKKKNQRLFLIAICFLLFAIIVLVTATVLACNGCKGKGEAGEATEQPSGTADLPSLETPVPVTGETVIPAGASINGVNVGNLTVDAAKAKLVSALDEKKNSVDITVSYESYEPLLLTADTIGLGWSEQDLQNALESAARGGSATVPMTFDSEKLRNALYALNDKIPNHAINAQPTVKYKNNKIDGVQYPQPYWDITEGQNGAKIDFDALEKQVSAAIDAGDYTASLTPSVTTSAPEITADSLKAQLQLLGSYSTSYYFTGSSSTDAATLENRQGRDHNIMKAIGMMQVVELKPGARFSFNKTTGDRTEKKGWALANAVYQGKGYRKESGGGVCQVSTTIFNAVLRSGITSITRSPHSIPSDYVTKEFEDGLGFDATVDWKDNHIDFGFKNDTGHTIYMFVYLTKNKDSKRKKNINVEIYGQKEDGVEYRCRNEILETTLWKADESKFEIEYDKTMLATAKRELLNTPHDGYKVKTYVDKYKDGKFVKTVRTEETIYKPVYPKYRVGTAVITPEPTKTPKPTNTPKPEETDHWEDEP